MASWGTATAAAVSFGFAIKFAFDVLYYDKELNRYRRFQCLASPGEDINCDQSGTRREFTLLPEHKAHRDQLKKEGDRFENYQWIAIGAGSVFAIASGILFYFGYLSEDPGTIAGDSHGNWKLQLSPLVGTSGATGGMQARFSF